MSAGFLPDRQLSHSATDFSSRLRAKIAGLFEGPILSQEGGYCTRAEPIAHSGPPNLGVRLVWISWNVTASPDITEHAGRCKRDQSWDIYDRLKLPVCERQ